jgi:small subunit ribosomal protein S12e
MLDVVLRVFTSATYTGCLTLEMKFKSMPPLRSRFPPRHPKESFLSRRLYRYVTITRKFSCALLKLFDVM